MKKVLTGRRPIPRKTTKPFMRETIVMLLFYVLDMISDEELPSEAMFGCSSDEEVQVIFSYFFSNLWKLFNTFNLLDASPQYLIKRVSII